MSTRETKTRGPCDLCGRAASASSRHHLIPKRCHGDAKVRTRHDAEARHRTVRLCSTCHKQIHVLFTEKELAESYHTVASLRRHPAMAKYLRWAAKQRPGRRLPVRRPRRR